MIALVGARHPHLGSAGVSYVSSKDTQKHSSDSQTEEHKVLFVTGSAGKENVQRAKYCSDFVNPGQNIICPGFIQ